MPKPAKTDAASYYHKYIDLIAADDLHEAFKQYAITLDRFLDGLPDSKADYAYDEGKWTVKQLLQHMIDAERIFAHRALWFARKTPTALSGFDENEYAAIADVSNRTLKSLVEEMKAVRRSTEFLFNSFSDKELNTFGTANTFDITVNALGFVILGHVQHHKKILKERYLQL